MWTIPGFRPVDFCAEYNPLIVAAESDNGRDTVPDNVFDELKCCRDDARDVVAGI